MASARHELMRRPSTMTVHAPHWPRSQPFLVPVKFSRSRRRSRSVTRGSSSAMVRMTPLMVRVVEKPMQCSVRAMVTQVRRSTKFGKTTLAARRCPGGVASLDTEVLVSALLPHHMRRDPPLFNGCTDSRYVFYEVRIDDRNQPSRQ